MPSLDWTKGHDISQGYLSLIPEIRIRKKDDKYFITKKSDGTIIREETETEITEITYTILQDLVQGNMIEKTRFEIPIKNSLVAELDVYNSQLSGLVTVEVEFPNEEVAQSFIPPEWFGLEVTSDKRYKNKNLSKLDTPHDLIGTKNVVKKKTID